MNISIEISEMLSDDGWDPPQWELKNTSRFRDSNGNEQIVGNEMDDVF